MAQQFLQSLFSNPIFVYVLLAWTLTWKALALWKAARREQKFWFIALLVINTLGLLEIAYYFFLYKVDISRKDQKLTVTVEKSSKK